MLKFSALQALDLNLGLDLEKRNLIAFVPFDNS